MPVTKFSSRKATRRASSEIEDEGPSNPPNQVSLKRERKNVDDEDDEEIIDINNFQDQPLGKNDGQKLINIGKDWLSMEQTVKQNWKVVGDVAVSIADNGEGQEVEKVRPTIRHGPRALPVLIKNVELIDIGVEMRSHQQTLDDIAQKIAQGEEIVGDHVCPYNILHSTL
jgi:hypothetical protein